MARIVKIERTIKSNYNFFTLFVLFVDLPICRRNDRMVSSLSVPLAEKDEKNYKFSNGFLLTLFYGDFDGRDRHLNG